MNTVRLNITLPDNLALKMNSFIKPRQRSKFIADQQQLEEGYRERNKESLEITKEFENLDISGWDEY
jgi:metal-responsive CopG/Arc/MetJ family transcriptional regulator